MDDNTNQSSSDIADSTPSELDALSVLDVSADVAKYIEPVLAAIVKSCIGVARERRLEIQARLTARLHELNGVFSELDARRRSEAADRDLQFRALSILLDLASASGDPAIVSAAMDAFKEYVRSAPSLTRDFTSAMTAVEPRLEVFPAREPED